MNKIFDFLLFEVYIILSNILEYVILNNIRQYTIYIYIYIMYNVNMNKLILDIK